MKLKFVAPVMAYIALAVGLFWMHSAWGALIGFHIALLSPIVLRKPDIPFPFLFRSKNPKWIFLSILACAGSGIALYFLWPYFGIADDLPKQLEAIGLTSSTWPGFIAYFAFINPFIEEYFWRGHLGSVSKNLSVYDAVYSGYHVLILLGKVHVASILLAFVILTFAGWFWRQITRADMGLLAAALGHMAADFSILYIVFQITT
jgi:hypothetical protein